MMLETLSFNNGVSRIALALSEEYLKRGHEVHLYASKNALPEGGRSRFPDPRMGLHWLPSLRGSWRTWSLPLGALLPLLGLPLGGRTMGRALMPSGRRHDVVISHALTVRQDVIQMHNDPQPVEREKLARVPFSIDPPRLGTTRGATRAALERMRFAPGNYRSVIAHSRRSADEVRAAFGVPETAVDVIPHGVDCAFFCPEAAAGRRVALRRRLGLGLDDVAFLYIGDSWKGLEFAIRGLARLPASGRAVLLAAGPFPKAPFQRFAQELGVRLLTEELWDDVRSLYAAADAIVNPTPMDTFFLVGLEGMAMRLPLVTTRYAGLSELLAGDSGGILLDDTADVAGIAEACARLLEPDVRVRMAEAARRFALTRTWEDAARRHLRHYAGLRESTVRC